jgi:hypothetical protein
MQIAARDAHICVARRASNLRERLAASQRVADKRVAAVMDGQCFQAGGAERLARRAEPLARRAARERFHGAAGNQRRQERLVVFGAGEAA